MQALAKILIIDDDENAALAVQILLESYNYDVYCAPDGQQGVEMARRIRPDLILMDLFMPVCDGYRATEILRNEPPFKRTPIIGFSAYVAPAEAESLKVRGFDDLIVKPVLNMTHLVERVRHWLRPRTQTAPMVH